MSTPNTISTVPIVFFRMKDFFPKICKCQKYHLSLHNKIVTMAIISRHNRARMQRESKMIFASSCIESAARRRNISTSDMYQRMKRVGLIDGFILKCYEGLHTQSRQHVTEDVLGALDLWETKKGLTK